MIGTDLIGINNNNNNNNNNDNNDNNNNNNNRNNTIVKLYWTDLKYWISIGTDHLYAWRLL